MCVPLHVSGAAAGDDTDEADTLLHHAAGKQTTPAVVVGRLFADAVEVERFLRFLGYVEHGGSFRLHFESEIVGVNTGCKLRVVRSKRRLIEAADQTESLAPLVYRNAR